MSQQQKPPATKSALIVVDLLKLAILGIFLIIIHSIVTNWDDFKARMDATPLHNPLTSEAANKVARMRAPPRCLDSRLGTPVIRSMPSATAKSIELAPMAYTAKITVCSPELRILVCVVNSPWQHADENIGK